MKFILLVLVIFITAFAQNSDPVLPDTNLTPGVILTMDTSCICRHGYTETVRNVTTHMRLEVFQRYRMLYARGYEVDHKIPLCLGGSNDIKNLWPQSYTGQWNARVKDKLEVRLYRMVCNGQMSLATAQKLISGNWIDSYLKYCQP